MARATASKRNDRPIRADSQPEAVESQSAHPTWEEIAGLAYSFWEARGYQGDSRRKTGFAPCNSGHNRETARSRPLRSKAAKVGA
jgi:hypothetical protein